MNSTTRLIAFALLTAAAISLFMAGSITGATAAFPAANANSLESVPDSENDSLQEDIDPEDRVDNYSSPDGKVTTQGVQRTGVTPADSEETELQCNEIDGGQYQNTWEKVFNTTNWHPPDCPNTSALSENNYPLLFSDLPTYDRDYDPAEWNDTLPFFDLEDDEYIDTINGTILIESTTDTQVPFGGSEYTYNTERIFNQYFAEQGNPGSSVPGDMDEDVYDRITESATFERETDDALRHMEVPVNTSIIGVSPSTTFLGQTDDLPNGKTVVSNQGGLQFEVLAKHARPSEPGICDDERPPYTVNNRFVDFCNSYEVTNESYEFRIDGSTVDQGKVNSNVFTIDTSATDRDPTTDSLDVELEYEVDWEVEYFLDGAGWASTSNASDSIETSLTLEQFTDLGEETGDTIYYRPIGELGEEQGYYMMIDIPEYTTDIVTPHAHVETTWSVFNARSPLLSGSSLHFVYTYAYPERVEPQLQGQNPNTRVQMSGYRPVYNFYDEIYDNNREMMEMEPDLCRWGLNDADFRPTNAGVYPDIQTLDTMGAHAGYDRVVPPAPTGTEADQCSYTRGWFYTPNQVVLRVDNDRLPEDEPLNDYVNAHPAVYHRQWSEDQELVEFQTERLPPARPTNVTVEITDIAEFGDSTEVTVEVEARDEFGDTSEPLGTLNEPAEIEITAGESGLNTDIANTTIDTNAGTGQGTTQLTIDDPDEWDGTVTAELTGVGPFPTNDANETVDDLTTVYVSSQSTDNRWRYENEGSIPDWIIQFGSMIIPPVVYVLAGLLLPMWLVYRGIKG